MPENNYITTVGELIKHLQSFPPDIEFLIYYEKRDQWYCPEKLEIAHTDDGHFFDPPEKGVVLRIPD